MVAALTVAGVARADNQVKIVVPVPADELESRICQGDGHEGRPSRAAVQKPTGWGHQAGPTTHSRERRSSLLEGAIYDSQQTHHLPRQRSGDTARGSVCRG